MSSNLAETLTKCLIDVFYALESIDDSDLDDLCTNLLEQAASDLISLSQPDKDLFIKLVKIISEKYPDEHKEFLLRFPEMLGLIA